MDRPPEPVDRDHRLSGSEGRGSVIAPLFEDLAVKKAGFRGNWLRLEAGPILATTTSYLNIDELARHAPAPHDVVGMLSSPANVMCGLAREGARRRHFPSRCWRRNKVGNAGSAGPTMVGPSRTASSATRMLGKRCPALVLQLWKRAPRPGRSTRCCSSSAFPWGPVPGCPTSRSWTWLGARKRVRTLTGARISSKHILDQDLRAGPFWPERPRRLILNTTRT